MSDSKRAGILAGGNWIIDHVKVIDTWPPQEALANIVSQSWGNGGSPYNILKNLSKLGARFPLAGIGLVGDDADGQRILADCRDHGIDVRQIRSTPLAPTSYSDVMTVGATGRRTFFHHRGANAFLAPEHFDFTSTSARIFHLGYLLLLDTLDALDGDLPCASLVLQRARASGLRVSVDCVSENSDRFSRLVKPLLPEVDILFANDFEAERITGVALMAGEPPMIQHAFVEQAAKRLIEYGVREWAVIHYPAAVYALHRDGTSHWQPSVRLPVSQIKGTAGAGDALAAGVLLGLHEGWSIAETLEMGVCAAAASLTDATCSNGLLPMEQCRALGTAHGWSTES